MTTASPAILPPQLLQEPSSKKYVIDISGRRYSRDIGRSFTLGHRTYYIYGDTFCFNAKDEYIGLSDNTVSLLLDRNIPHESGYLSLGTDELVQPLLKMHDDEAKFSKDPAKTRIVLWSFGGVVETEPGTGYMWYEKGIVTAVEGSTMPHHEHLGVGIAKIFQSKSDGNLHTWRAPGLLFDRYSPRHGSMSVHMEGDIIYLYGLKIDTTEIVLARVNKAFALDARAYEHYTSHGFSPRLIGPPLPLWKDIYQGGVFPTTLFGPGIAYAAIGVGKWGDSKIRVGVSPARHGPWEWTEVGTATGIDKTDGIRYCIYPHPWSLDPVQKSIMVTWSEQWPGGVIAAKLYFK